MLLRCPEPGRYVDAAGRSCAPAQLQRELAASGKADTLVLALPAVRCLFTALRVSPAEQRHLARLLPWKFEDSLIAPAEDMHFAHGPVQGGIVPVTAVARDWLAQVLEQARRDGLQVMQVICELELLPWQQDHWTLRVESDGAGLHCLLRYDRHEGLVCSPANLSLLLQSLAAERGALPARLLLQGEPVQLATLRMQLPAAWRDIAHEAAAHWQAPPPDAACNLLQGAFAAPLPWALWWRQWRLAAALLLGLLLSDLAFTGLGLWQEGQALAELQAEIRREVETVLPGAVLADPLLQLRRVVAARGGASDSGLLSLLTRMAPVLAAQPDVRIEGLDFRGDQGELQVLVDTSDFAAVETLRAAFEALGLRAELLGSSRQGGRSRSRLRVQG